jgi:hypothetical protein
VKVEWDPRKAAGNKRKHGVSFDEAVTCFADPLGLLLEDAAHPGVMKKANKKATKKARKRREWSEVRDLDFAAYRLKKNRFATRVKKEGILFVHDGPSLASLRAVPEADFARVKVRRNTYAERIQRGGLTLQVGRGRPRSGAETGRTVVKSVRLPPVLWKELAKLARARGVAVHALVRHAIMELLQRAVGH